MHPIHVSGTSLRLCCTVVPRTDSHVHVKCVIIIIGSDRLGPWDWYAISEFLSIPAFFITMVVDHDVFCALVISWTMDPDVVGDPHQGQNFAAWFWDHLSSPHLSLREEAHGENAEGRKELCCGREVPRLRIVYEVGLCDRNGPGWSRRSQERRWSDVTMFPEPGFRGSTLRTQAGLSTDRIRIK